MDLRVRTLVILCLAVGLLSKEICGQEENQPSSVIRYNMAELLQWRNSPLVSKPDIPLPSEMKVRKRGRKGGVRARNKRRGFRPILPKIVLGNVQ